MMDVKWNCFIQELLRMHAELPLRDRLMQELARMDTELPLPPPPAEIPLADAIQQGVAHFLSSADVVDVEPVDEPTNRMRQRGFLPSSPISTSSSRLPTSGSSDGWEYVPLDRWKDCGYSQATLDNWPSDGHPNDEVVPQAQQAVQSAPETLQLPSSSLAKLQPKAPPKPPFNLFPPQAQGEVPLKAAPPPKPAPPHMGPPPVTPPLKSPPNTRPLKTWIKKAPREIMCPRCGHGTILHQFM